MRQAFTLVELMIVIAIIAIIAAIAIPNLLESRITANESAAATSLKAGLFPAQIQYQSGGYVDVDGNGRGVYAVHCSHMAGSTQAAAANAINNPPTKPLSLLESSWSANSLAPANANSVQTTSTIAAVTTRLTSHAAYNYGIVLDIATESNAETYFGAYAVPATSENAAVYDGANGRRSFGLNAGGAVVQSRGSVTYANLNFGVVSVPAAATSLHLTSPINTGAPVGAAGAPYIK
jgi:prepilin-type N-terminal cleavage/methylation domain-containing protein